MRRGKKLEEIYNFSELNKMISEITTGDLGTVLKNERWELYSTDSLDKLYSFSDNKMSIQYGMKGFSSLRSGTMHKSYEVFYDGTIVYLNEDNTVLHLDKDVTWINELYKLYEKHFEIVARKRGEQQIQQESLERQNRVRSIFGLVDPSGYSDDKIIIDNVEHRFVPAPDWSNSKDEEILNGRIRLFNGEILMDTRQCIYHPGKWEYYVCDLVDTLESEKAYEQQLKKEAYAQKQKIKKLELKRKYEENHSPIDDSRFF